MSSEIIAFELNDSSRTISQPFQIIVPSMSFVVFFFLIGTPP